MLLADTHCHLQDDRFDADREEVIARALDQLAFVVTVGDTLPASEAALGLTRTRVYASAGIHPHHAGTWSETARERLCTLLRWPAMAAVGEIGLDYHYEKAPRAVQLKTFEAQLGLAVELQLPVIIHCREAEEDAAPLLERFGPLLPGGVMHCFSGDAAFAERCLDWGFHISFAGNVTFPNAAALREAACAVPLDRLLVETDSPYLAPQPVRGKRCEPVCVVHTAKVLAGLKHIDEEEFAGRTTRNAMELFGIAA